MFTIDEILAREILDSRGNPTVEVDCILESGVLGRAAVPAGASTGQREALELRDGGDRYLGKGVSQAVDRVGSKIAPELEGLDVRDQAAIDRLLVDLDGTDDKSNLGANAILGVSLAVARAAAEEAGLPLFAYLGGPAATLLPVPLLNVLNGGEHADNSVDVQEFMLVPHGFEAFSEALRAGAEIYHHLKQVLLARDLSTGIGDEGGFAPDLGSTREALDLLLEAVEKAGYRAGEEVSFALDVAASELVEDGDAGGERRYALPGEGQSGLVARDLIGLYREWVDAYPLVSIEDGLAEDDWPGWRELTRALGERVQLVGDDLFVTNPEVVRRGIEENVANSLLVKVNQIGTLTETMEAVELAKSHGFSNVVSHRSGETEDTFIADLAVAIRAGQIKAGAPCRSDRTAKYNRLLRIEEELAEGGVYRGDDAYPRRRSG